MEHDLRNTAVRRRYGSSQAVRCCDAQGKGLYSPHKLSHLRHLHYQIVYDIHQLPRESLPSLRDSLVTLLSKYRAGPKPVRTQLCVCLADLAIQMLEWKDVLPLILSTLGSDPESIPCVLEFLHVLPEEVTEGRKINLTVRSAEISSSACERLPAVSRHSVRI